MKADKGVAESIEPTTIIEIDKVAQQAFDARVCPASPAIVKIIGICAPRIAWAATSTQTFLRDWVKAGAVSMKLMGHDYSARPYLGK